MRCGVEQIGWSGLGLDLVRCWGRGIGIDRYIYPLDSE